MTDLLREELSRLADRGPAARLPTDLWARGRRARLRDRVALGAAVAAVLVAVGASASLLAVPPPSRISPAAPVEGPVAVPARLFAVPEHVSDDPDERTGDLAVGRSSAAFVTAAGRPVAVDAQSGAYTLLDLPGWSYDPLPPLTTSPSESQPLAVSADGLHLVWAYDDADEPAGGGSGIRVADLGSGEVTEHVLRNTGQPGLGLDVTSVGFAGSGEDIIWAGRDETFAHWHGYTLRADWLRSIGPETTPTTVGVNARGETLELRDGTAVVPSVEGVGHANRLDAEGLDQPTPLAQFSPDGRRVLVGSVGPQDHVDIGDLDAHRVTPVELPSETFPTGASTAPLGWVDDQTAVVLTRAHDQRDQVGLVSDQSYVVATRVEPGVQHVSVAVDLLDVPTVARPEPDWPVDSERLLLLLAVAGLSGVVTAGWLARR